MKYQEFKTNPLKNKGLSTMAIVAIISGVAIGTAIGSLFITSKGGQLKGKIGDLFNYLTGNTQARAKDKLSHLITDVRSHIQKNAAGLLTRDSDNR